MLVQDKFYVTFNNNYNKITILLYLFRVYRHGAGNFKLEVINENFVNITYLEKNDISLKIDTNKNDIASNLGKISTDEGDISSNLGKISTNEGNISSNLSKITTNEEDISSNLGKISTNEGNISSNLGKINNITKTIMLKNIYFTDFDSKKDEVFVKELLYLDKTHDRSRYAIIHTANMGYYFKKDDIIEIDCKLMISHSTYEYANNILLYYDLYDEKTEDNNIIFREIRRYNQFSLMSNKSRIIAYTKLCYKVKYNINNIIFVVYITTAHRKMNLILQHHIIQNGTNYISIKHYGKS